MYGIELIFIVHLAYYSLIPIKVSCVPFSGLKALRYASGATPFLSMLSETKIIKNYSSLGISSNFLMNVNILLVLLLIIPLVYFPMKFKKFSVYGLWW